MEGAKIRLQLLGLRVAGTLFGLLALAQLGRLMIRPEVMVAGHHIPLWPNMLAMIVLGSLSVWMWCCHVFPSGNVLSVSWATEFHEPIFLRWTPIYERSTIHRHLGLPDCALRTRSTWELS